MQLVGTAAAGGIASIAGCIPAASSLGSPGSSSFQLALFFLLFLPVFFGAF